MPHQLLQRRIQLMAVQRDKAYCNFNFLVDLGTGNTEGPGAGFEDVLMPEGRLDVIEYRNGNDKECSGRTLTGLEHCWQVVLKRGSIRSLSLCTRYYDGAHGAQN